MSVSASSQGGLLIRLDPDTADRLPHDPHVSNAIMGGREMRGWLRVDAEAVRTKAALRKWVRRAVDHAKTLPPK